MEAIFIFLLLTGAPIKRGSLTKVDFQSISPLGRCRNVRLSVRVFVRVFVCVFTFEVPFKRLFAPTSQSWMSNIF